MKQKTIGILGMHRSGTSCLAGSLQEQGLILGDVYTSNPHNLKGNREHKAIQQLNDDVLIANGGSWMEPPASCHWSTTDQTRLVDIVSGFSKEPAWGFKDPRTLFVLDGWLAAVPNMRFVGSFRHPYAVAASLQKRHSGLKDDAFWLELWFQYNQRLLALYQESPFPLINFDSSEKKYKQTLSMITGQLGLRDHFFQRLLRLQLKPIQKNKFAFFEASLRHNHEKTTEALPAHIKELYAELINISL